MVLVSVIIPVYNAQLHLKKCIDSLLSQTLQSCEFIFVTDGSTDGSQKIIEDFQKADNRIILINQENQGVSAARNRGLQIAKGDYIGFVDADDTVSPTHFQTLLEIAQRENTDIVISKYFIHQKEKQQLSQTIFPESKVLDSDFIQKEIIPHLIQTENLNAIWNKLFRRELILKNNITFPVGVALGEDGWFNIHAFQHAKSIYFTDLAGYHYFEMEGSATKDFKSKNYFERILEEYQLDYSAFENMDLNSEKITKLKAEKCLNKTVSLLHEYANPKNKLGFKEAFRKVSLVLNNALFQKILSDNYKEVMAKKSRYEQFLLRAIKNKWIYLLFTAMAYSRFRNQ